MANALTRVAEQARAASLALYEFGTSLFNPTVRLGVTGLSRAGKTVSALHICRVIPIC